VQKANDLEQTLEVVRSEKAAEAHMVRFPSD
jgi:hypothetical protein